LSSILISVSLQAPKSKRFRPSRDESVGKSGVKDDRWAVSVPSGTFLGIDSRPGPDGSLRRRAFYKKVSGFPKIFNK